MLGEKIGSFALYKAKLSGGKEWKRFFRKKKKSPCKIFQKKSSL